eukprot:1724039-Alexandrium_andersonii.AAC.2
MAEVLLKKHRGMLEAVAAEGSFKHWLEKQNASADDEEQMITRHEDLEDKFNKWRAFADKGASREAHPRS